MSVLVLQITIQFYEVQVNCSCMSDSIRNHKVCIWGFWIVNLTVLKHCTGDHKPCCSITAASVLFNTEQSSSVITRCEEQHLALLLENKLLPGHWSAATCC